MKSNNLNNPNLYKGQCKDKHSFSQFEIVFKALHVHPKTVTMLRIETGFSKTDIRNYITKLKKLNRIRLVRHGICIISKCRAGYYTTNPDLFPIVEPSKFKGDE